MFQNEIHISEQPVSAETTASSHSEAGDVHCRAHYALDHETRAPVAEVLVPPDEVIIVKVDELIDPVLICQIQHLRF